MLAKGSVILVQLLLSYAWLLTAASAELCQVNSTSPTCRRLHKIEQTLNEKVNPCEDFYGYVCNKFELRSNNDYQLADHEMNLKLITIMEGLYPQPEAETQRNHSILDKSYIYYKSCVSERRRDVLPYFEVIKPGKDLEWPLLQELQAHRRADNNFQPQEWSEGQFDVFALLAQLQSYGLKNILINQQISVADSTLIIEPAGMEKEAVIAEYEVMAVLLEWGLPEQLALKYSKNIMKMEKRRQILYDSYTSQSVDSISYLRLKQELPYLSVLLEGIYRQKFPDSFRVELYEIRFFQSLLTEQWSAKDAQDICNYLMIRFALHLEDDRAQDFAQLECIKELKRKLDLPVNLLYYYYVYKPQEMIYNSEIFDLFKRALNQTLDPRLEAYWSSMARSHISSIALNLGNIPRNLRMPEIEKLFEHIPQLELDNYRGNHLHLLRHCVLKTVQPLKRRTYSIGLDNSEDGLRLSSYDASIHMVTTSLAMIQPPIYHYTYDPIFKWSRLGKDFAYNIVFDALPDMLQLDEGNPWEECIEQMGNDESINDIFAHLLSTHVAYAAYAHERQDALQPKFSNIPWKKLFFLNLSQYWCGHKDDAWIERLFENFKHLASFQEAFQCPQGSKMNTQNCRLL